MRSNCQKGSAIMMLQFATICQCTESSSLHTDTGRPVQVSCGHAATSGGLRGSSAPQHIAATIQSASKVARSFFVVLHSAGVLFAAAPRQLACSHTYAVLLCNVLTCRPYNRRVDTRLTHKQASRQCRPALARTGCACSGLSHTMPLWHKSPTSNVRPASRFISKQSL